MRSVVTLVQVPLSGYTDVGLIAAQPRDIRPRLRDARPHKKGHSASVFFSVKSSETIKMKHAMIRKQKVSAVLSLAEELEFWFH